MTLQERAVRWHEERFPKAERHHVALKSLSELGEMADAILQEEGKNSVTGKTGDGITGEAADVLITLLVLTGRWSGENLMAAAERKLAILETPGAHKASLEKT